MRILYLHHGYGPGLAGAEIMAYRMALAVARQGHDVSFMRAVSPSFSGGCRRRIEFLDVSLQQLNEMADLCVGGERWELIHYVDLVHSDYAKLATALAERLRLPLVVTPATVSDLWESEALGRAVLRRAERVLAFTVGEAEQLERLGAHRDVIRLVPQGVHLRDVRESAAFRRRYAIEGDYVLFLGRKMRAKGLDLLQDAMAKVWETLPALELVVIGPPASGPEDIETVKSPRVRDIGFVDEDLKAAALAGAKLVCVPSRTDVFPIVMMEAWKAQAAMVVGRFPGAENIVRDGVDAILAELDGDAIARAIVGLANRPDAIERLTRNGAARAGRKHSWPAVARAISKIYEELLARLSPKPGRP